MELIIDTVLIDSSFHVLLDKCLRVQPTDQLLVLYDEDFNSLYDVLVRVVTDRSLSATFVMLPKLFQLKMLAMSDTPFQANTLSIPAPIRAAIGAATIVLCVLNGDMDTTSVRRAIIQQPRSGHCRLAHIPGVSPDILAVLAASPIDSIIQQCEDLAWLLGESRSAEVSTSTANGQHHTLSIALEGWDTEPIMSPGLIHPGSWGNIPPGETFCCPPIGGVNGSICINGSVPGHVLRPEDEVCLYFQAGKLTKWIGKPTSPAVEFFAEEQTKADKSGDSNWNCFAELGIGLNPAISQLTGNSLFDEKVAGTVHIAIGDNSGFGHTISSSLHADLVTTRPSLTIDGTQVIIDGKHVLQTNNLNSVPLLTSEDDFPEEAVVYIRETKMQIVDGLLLRRLTSAHRVGLIRMADARLARATASLANQIMSFDRVNAVTLIDKWPTIEGVATRDLLRILYHFRILGVDGLLGE